MLKVKVNGREKEFPGSKGADLGEVMDKLFQQIVTPSQVITSVKVDGREITSELQPEYRSLPAEQIESIELETADPEELIESNLASAAEYLTRVIPATEKAAELFRLGEEIEANELYAQCLEGLRWLIRLVQGTDKLQRLREGKHLLGEEFQSLPSITDGMLQAQEDQDWIMLADLLEYELIPLLRQWQDRFIAVSSQAEEKQEDEE